MNSVKVPITIIVNDNREQAVLICNSKTTTITFTMNNGYKKCYSDSNFYTCFGSVRKDHPEITFLCKGARINVHPSSMSLQMTQGMKAYELKLGKQPHRNDLVNIFDYEEENLTNDPEIQEDFFMTWINTETTDK